MRPVLAVEDDRKIARVLAPYLEEAGYRVDDEHGHLVDRGHRRQTVRENGVDPPGRGLTFLRSRLLACAAGSNVDEHSHRGQARPLRQSTSSTPPTIPMAQE